MMCEQLRVVCFAFVCVCGVCLSKENENEEGQSSPTEPSFRSVGVNASLGLTDGQSILY